MAWRYAGLLVCVVVGAMGCGDPPTRDDRGYTKSPLERPGLIIRSSEAFPMRDLGQPNLPDAREIEVPGEGATPPGTQPPARDS